MVEEEGGMMEVGDRRLGDLEARDGSCPAVEGDLTVTGLLPRQARAVGVEVEEEGEEVLISEPGRTLEVEEERPLHGPGMTG